jgi:hypothetical protein
MVVVLAFTWPGTVGPLSTLLGRSAVILTYLSTRWVITRRPFWPPR